jgi:hypothetical protein
VRSQTLGTRECLVRDQIRKAELTIEEFTGLLWVNQVP